MRARRSRATPPIATKFARARKDPIGTLIAACARPGSGSGGPAPYSRSTASIACPIATRRCSTSHEQAILERLREPGGDGAALLDQLGVWTEVVRTREDAVRIIAELPASCGLDCETTPRRNSGSPRPWIAITKKGERAKHQPDLKDKAGLDPHKAGCA